LGVIDSTLHRRVLLDTGPLVAVFRSDDDHHQQCVETLGRIAPPLLTCWPVLTEALWLLRHDTLAIRELLLSADRGELSLLELGDRDLREIESLFAKYHDLSPQLADLALLHLAQRENLSTVFTLDRRDFTVFRLKGKQRLKLLPNE
jgi:uncharacterized protein